MTSAIHPNEGVRALARLLRASAQGALDEARRRIAKLDRANPIQQYRAAYAANKLLATYLMAEELIERGTPPCFWHETLALGSASLARRRILVLGDMAWLRRWYPDHDKAVRYQRIKTLLTGPESMFLCEAEFAFYEGKRPAWQLVKSLSMTERQQWDAVYASSGTLCTLEAHRSRSKRQLLRP